MDPEALLEGLDDAQRAAVISTAQPLVVLAPAGSGKTRVLTRRIAHRVASETADPRHVLALTFTRKAAGELDDRLRRLGLRGDVTTGTFHAVAWGALRTRWADQGRTALTLL
ncbi:MAG: UvrD-helicase domain-containing protein, partial [Acidimicrobiales bacterium]